MECPKCGSSEVELLPWLGLIYRCRNCGYLGPVVLFKPKSGNSSPMKGNA